jgi:hypothetical protein
MTVIVDSADAPTVVTRTLLVTPENPGDTDLLDPAALTTAITIATSLDVVIPTVLLDPEPIAVAFTLTATELIDATALDPAPITVTLDLVTTTLIDATVLGATHLAATVTLTAALVDARVPLSTLLAVVPIAFETDLSIEVAGATGVPLGGGLPAKVYHDYNPDLLVLRRATSVTSRLGAFTLGKSKFATPATVWVNIPAATVTINQSYAPDTTTYPTPPPKGPQRCFHTLLIEQETASIALSYWDNPGPLLYAGDIIEVRYAGELLFKGTVDSTALTYVIDPEASRHGATRRVDFSATAAGTYAVMMGRIVKWKNLPQETAIRRIRRWVTVKGWD